MRTLCSRSMVALAGLAALAAPAAAEETTSHTAAPVRTAAVSPPSATAPVAARPVAEAPTLRAPAVVSGRSYRRFGVMADAGVPDGASPSLVVRPMRALRLHVGGSYNGISNGVRAGVTVVPLPFWVSPTLTVDVGRYAEGDANPLARRISGDETFSSPMLERVGYDYLNAHLGLELGRKWATFYLHAGMSRVSGQVRNVEAAFDGAEVSIEEDPTVTMWTPSARLGLIFYFAK